MLLLVTLEKTNPGIYDAELKMYINVFREKVMQIHKTNVVYFVLQLILFQEKWQTRSL